MRPAFLQVEILGPRATLDRWLEGVQEHGRCHVVDALLGLEGEPGISRPTPTRDENDAATMRSEALRRLRAVERVLPRTAPDGNGSAPRPSFSVGASGQGLADVERDAAAAGSVGGKILAALEAGRDADRSVEAAEARQLLLSALPPARSDPLGVAYAFSAERPVPRRRLERFTRDGASVWRAVGERQAVVVLDVPSGQEDRFGQELARLGGRKVEWEPDLLQGGRAAALARATEALAHAKARDREALGALRRVVDAEGPRARRFLDALEDAEARARLRDRLATTEQVTALRAWVPSEDVDALETRLRVRVGPEVVVRALGDGTDAPAAPRRVAPVPLAALQGVGARRFGEVTAPALLALAVPIAFGLAWADLAGGLLLLLGGAFLQIGAVPGSPRRDTSLLAEVAGLGALLGGLLAGHGFGALGASWFGVGWGFLPGEGGWAEWPSALRFTWIVGAAAAAGAAWGLGVASGRARGGGPAGARAGLGVALPLVVVAGAAAATLPAGTVLHALWWTAPVAAIALLVVAGLREGGGRLVLDLAATVRLVAVPLFALEVASRVFARLAADPSAAGWIVGVPLLAVATLAAVVDPAHVAMGVPYDLSLGGRALAEPYAPFARRGRDGGER